MEIGWKKQFITIYAGQAFSILGSAVVQFAVIWWITMQTESAISLSFATIAAMLPTIFLGPIAGVYVDRYSRRFILIVSDLLVGLTSIVIAFAFMMTPVPPLGLIYFMLFMRGVGNSFHGPAMQASIPMLVPKEMLTKAGAWGSLVNSISNMVGPVLGAALMSVFPIASIMLVDIVGALLASFCLLFVEFPPIEVDNKEFSLWGDMKEGFRTLTSSKQLKAIFPTAILCNIIFNPISSFLPLMVKMHFLGDAWHNSIVNFANAAGILTLSAVMGVWGGMKKRFLMIALAISFVGIVALSISQLPPEAFWIFVVFSFILAGSTVLINVPIMSYIQETVEGHLLGKVFSLIYSVLNVTMQLGLLIAGPLCEKIGVNQMFLGAGVFMIVISLVFRVMTKQFDHSTEEQ